MLCYHYFVFAFVKATLADTPCPHKFSGRGVSAGDSFGICEFCAVCSKSAPMQSFVIQSNTALWDCCRIAFLSLFVQNNPYFCVAKTTILPFGNSPFMHRAMFVFSSGAVAAVVFFDPHTGRIVFANGNTPPTLINADCGYEVNTCSTGTLEDVADTSTDHIWKCLGSGGGNSVTCYRGITAEPSNKTLNVFISGSGTVSSAGLSCETDCSTTVASGAIVTLSAAPAEGFIFAGWSISPSTSAGLGCGGTGTCTVTMNASTAVTAMFSRTSSGLLKKSSANPRYFADPSGKIVYLTGSHTWNNLQDFGNWAAFDYAGYLNFIKTKGHSVIRLWQIDEPNLNYFNNAGSVNPLPFAKSAL